MDPTREEAVLKELLKERQHFSWDAAYGGVEMHEDEEPERGPFSLRIDIPEVTDNSFTTLPVAQTTHGAKTLLRSKSGSYFGFGRGYHRLFDGGPRHGSNIARLTNKLDRLIVLSESSLLGWFLQVPLIVIIKGMSPMEVSLIVIIKQVSS